MAREVKERARRDVMPMHPEPGPEHLWLEKFLGEWEYQGEMTMAPNAEPQETTGEERVRSLGGLWVVFENEGTMADEIDAESIMILGYDPLTARFVGTWTASMMTTQWVYEGDLDEDSDELTLYAQGPDLSGSGSMAMYRDVLTFESDDHRTLRSYIQEKEGEWRQFVEVNHRRKTNV